MAERPPLICWLTAITVPVLAGVLGWATMGTTTTARACAAGSGGSTGQILLFLALVALAPGSFIVVARRSKLPVALAVPTAILTTLLAAFAVFMGDQIWWGAHNCMT
jgi:hypothetical protein